VAVCARPRNFRTSRAPGAKRFPRIFLSRAVSLTILSSSLFAILRESQTGIAVWDYEYGGAYQLTGALKSVAGAITKRYHYAYDAMGNRTGEQIDYTVTTGVFNNLNQLGEIVGGGKLRVSGAVSEPARVTAGGQEIDVTAAGNFSGDVPAENGDDVTVRAEDASGNATERVESVTVQNGDRKVFEYDLNGNTTKITTHPADGSATRVMEFEWDAKDQMVAITQSDGRRSEFSYDGYGRRVRIVETDNSAVVEDRKFVWLGLAIAEERGANGSSVAKRFLPGGEQRVGAGGAATGLYYAKDHLGSIREVADASGAVRARYEYDAYGRRLKIAGDLESDFGFTGHFYHAASGLHLAPFRAYDPETGRWLSLDPLREVAGLNMYLYVSSNPIVYSDPLGLMSRREKRKAIAAYAASMLKLVKAGKTTSCEALAGILGYAAGLYRDTGFLGVNDDEEHFSEDVSRILAGIDEWGNRNHTKDQVEGGPKGFDDSGFKKQFQDCSNQVQHFAGGMQMGNQYGRWTDLVDGIVRPDTQADLNLNSESIAIGAGLDGVGVGLGLGSDGISDIEQTILDRICDPKNPAGAGCKDKQIPIWEYGSLGGD